MKCISYLDKENVWYPNNPKVLTSKGMCWILLFLIYLIRLFLFWTGHNEFIIFTKFRKSKQSIFFRPLYVCQLKYCNLKGFTSRFSLSICLRHLHPRQCQSSQCQCHCQSSQCQCQCQSDSPRSENAASTKPVEMKV